jgi:uncharacterized protein YjbI with pentapeptide repeats
MLTRRNRDLLPQKTEPLPFAAKAKDLGTLRDTVIDSAGVGAGLWLSYLFVLFYFAIAAGAVTHRDLLLENSVKLPFLNVELPLKAFFVLGPLVFLIGHTYVLLHFAMLAGKVRAFHSELQIQIADDEARARLRRQLPSNIFVQFLAGPREVQTGIIGFLLRLIVQISLVAGPIALLALFQLQFLPYHSERITWWQRIAVIVDLGLLWVLWPSVVRGHGARLRGDKFKHVKVVACVLASAVPVLLVCTVATLPGEWMEQNLPSFPVFPTGWPPWNVDRGSLHRLLVAGSVDFVTGKPTSLWSNVLVLPNFAIGDHAISSEAVSLRGRSLEGAVFVDAQLRKADFTGAQLAGADVSRADLHEAKFGCAFSGELRSCTQLQGAFFAGAQLQGALLDRAWLQGTSFYNAQLQGASLNGAQLQGASLRGTKLQGASLNGAELEGALFKDTQLQGASLNEAQLQGARLDEVQLHGASLVHVFVWRAQPPKSNSATGALVVAPQHEPKYIGFDCDQIQCNWSEKSYLALKSLVQRNAYSAVDRAIILDSIEKLGKQPYIPDQAAEGWADLVTVPSRVEPYGETLANTLKNIGCTARGAPYVIRGLIPHLDDRFRFNRPREATVAAAFLDEASCPGARGLSDENKAILQEIRDRGPAVPPDSATAAR